MKRLGIAFLIIGCGAACGAVQEDEKFFADIPMSPNISYIVTGSTGVHVSLTYANATTKAVQIHDAAVPWRFDFTSEYVSDLSIVAQNKNDTGTVKCTIMRGGQVISSATSSGAFVIAQCGEAAR